MIVIKKIEIISFRSILNLTIEVDNTLNLIAICGENNVGKTNTLRAINLFFHPETYQINTDRPTIKEAQGGSRIDPKIIVEFLDDKSNVYYKVIRDFKFYEKKDNKELKCKTFKRRGKNVDSTTVKELSFKKTTEFLESIEFRYIESINIDIPQLVEELTTNVIDVQYSKTRITKSKEDLHKAYNDYITGLDEILNIFSENISGTFKNFKDNWSIKFLVPSSSETFRGLISDDVQLVIDDKGCLNVEQKGSGLQRLAVILLHFEIIKRMRDKKNFIFCIDEPDIYLHDGLQRKLMDFFLENSKNIQIFYTTHSKVFINQYSMKNIVLLGAEYFPKASVRKQRNIDVVETKLIDTNCDEGYEKICEHLGIEKNNYDVLQKNNILVEGGCDKKYLEEVANYFGIEKPKIISLDGVSNAEKYLEFYNSYYKDNTSSYKPNVKVLFDNDAAGRDVYKKILNKKYNFITVTSYLLQNFTGDGIMDIHKNNTNHEIEDLLYPDIMCYLINALLTKKSLHKIKTTTITSKIMKPAFKKAGILSLLDYEKNSANPDEEDIICFVSSNKATNDIKNGLAGMFNIAGDRALIHLMDSCKIRYPYVEKYINELFSFQ